MTGTPMARVAGVVACLGLAAGLTGCWVHVDKGANGEDKDVQVSTPFGGVHVQTDQTTASDLGLSAYPGAQIAHDKDNDKSADVHLGFGEWALRVKVVHYATPDSQEKVVAFYKKALGRYGDVLTCQDNAPVGVPAKTSEGLTCAEDGHANVQINEHGENYGYHPDTHGLQLKAGSTRHQHIVGFESPVGDETRFALVALDMPNAGGDGEKKSN